MRKKDLVYTSDGEVPPKGGKIHSARGAEILDTTPIEVPLYYRRPESLEEKLKRVVHNELSLAASARDMETFEESDDFDVEDDQDTLPSRYEMTDMQEEQPLMRRANADVNLGGKEKVVGGAKRKSVDKPAPGEGAGVGAGGGESDTGGEDSK